MTKQEKGNKDLVQIVASLVKDGEKSAKCFQFP